MLDDEETALAPRECAGISIDSIEHPRGVCSRDDQEGSRERLTARLRLRFAVLPSEEGVRLMRICRLETGVLILAVSMCGCSQTSLLRPAPGDNLKTIASVGDKPLPVRSGPSDSSVRAEVVEADLPPPGRGRISGECMTTAAKP